MKSLSKLSFFFIFFLLTSCNSKKQTTLHTNEEHSISSQTWVLASWMDNNIVRKLQTLESIQLTFNDSSNSIQGVDGCNSFFATYNINKDILIIKAGGGTKKYCGEESAKDEQDFIIFLEAKPTYIIEKGKLELSTKTEKLIFNTKN